MSDSPPSTASFPHSTSPPLRYDHVLTFQTQLQLPAAFLSSPHFLDGAYQFVCCFPRSPPGLPQSSYGVAEVRWIVVCFLILNVVRVSQHQYWTGSERYRVSEWVIKFNNLFGDSGQRGPYKPCMKDTGMSKLTQIILSYSKYSNVSPNVDKILQIIFWNVFEKMFQFWRKFQWNA